TEMILSDLYLGASHSSKINSWNSMELYFGGEIPSSAFSQKEGYHLIAIAGGRLTSDFVSKRLSLSNQVSGHGIANEYYYSPSTGGVNPVGGLSYSPSAAYRITKFWSLGASTGIRT